MDACTESNSSWGIFLTACAKMVVLPEVSSSLAVNTQHCCRGRLKHHLLMPQVSTILKLDTLATAVGLKLKLRGGHWLGALLPRGPLKLFFMSWKRNEREKKNCVTSIAPYSQWENQICADHLNETLQNEEQKIDLWVTFNEDIKNI